MLLLDIINKVEVKKLSLKLDEFMNIPSYETILIIQGLNNINQKYPNKKHIIFIKTISIYNNIIHIIYKNISLLSQ